MQQSDLPIFLHPIMITITKKDMLENKHVLKNGRKKNPVTKLRIIFDLIDIQTMLLCLFQKLSIQISHKLIGNKIVIISRELCSNNIRFVLSISINWWSGLILKKKKLGKYNFHNKQNAMKKISNKSELILWLNACE